MEKINKKYMSLKKNEDFKKVYQYGLSAADRYLVIYKLPNNNEGIRIGFSVSKKIGNAVKRNKTKRILREICRLNIDGFKNHHDYVIIVRVAAKDKDYHQLKSSVFRVLEKLYKSRGRKDD